MYFVSCAVALIMDQKIITLCLESALSTSGVLMQSPENSEKMVPYNVVDSEAPRTDSLGVFVFVPG